VQSDFFPLPEMPKRRPTIQVPENAWVDFALCAIRDLPKGWRGLPEDVRPEIEARYGAPRNPKAIYGAVTTEALKRGLWRKTGRRRPMRLDSSHGRMTDEYERI
jgi:hypothetical protein